MQPSTATDIHIAGAGLVGLTLALGLHRQGRRVLVSERGADPAQSQRSDERHLALAERSVRLLRDLGLPMEQLGEPIQAVHISSAGSFGATRWRAADQGLQRFGMVVPARRLLLAVRDALAGTTVELCFGQHIHKASAERDRIIASSADRRIESPLLAIADGADSALRDAAGIGADRHDYGADAIVAAIDVERPSDGEAFERFVPGGLVAILPQSGRRAGAVWVQPDDRCELLMALSEEDFAAQLQSAFGYRLGRIRRVGERVRYPLRRVMAHALIAERRVVIGNAAQTIHPIGAQGLNLGLRDVAELLARLGDDPGEPASLAAYASARRADRLAVCEQTHRLALTLPLRSPVATWARSLALLAADRVSPLREYLVLRGMGWRGASST
jgi:2-octaprenyl-6-methoxyphenol hydroxylase